MVVRLSVRGHCLCAWETRLICGNRIPAEASDGGCCARARICDCNAWGVPESSWSRGLRSSVAFRGSIRRMHDWGGKPGRGRQSDAARERTRLAAWFMMPLDSAVASDEAQPIPLVARGMVRLVGVGPDVAGGHAMEYMSPVAAGGTVARADRYGAIPLLRLLRACLTHVRLGPPVPRGYD